MSRSEIRFSDGINVEVSGDLRPLHLFDGWYVVGEGLLIPVADRSEALDVIADLRTRTQDVE